jgi:hypothetical protein
MFALSWMITNPPLGSRAHAYRSSRTQTKQSADSIDIRDCRVTEIEYTMEGENCANPLLLGWIKEWLDQARDRGSKGVAASVSPSSHPGPNCILTASSACAVINELMTR